MMHEDMRRDLHSRTFSDAHSRDRDSQSVNQSNLGVNSLKRPVKLRDLLLSNLVRLRQVCLLSNDTAAKISVA
jgi:hypothetical protein